MQFVFRPGETNDTRGLTALPLNLPVGISIYGDVGYTDYQAGDDLSLQIIRNRNSLAQTHLGLPTSSNTFTIRLKTSLAASLSGFLSPFMQ